MSPEDLEALRLAFRSLHVLDIMELLAVLRAELLERGDVCAANYCSRAASAHAAFSLSSDAPSDNGASEPGANEAGA